MFCLNSLEPHSDYCKLNACENVMVHHGKPAGQRQAKLQDYGLQDDGTTGLGSGAEGEDEDEEEEDSIAALPRRAFALRFSHLHETI
jgi:hypothetical protein